MIYINEYINIFQPIYNYFCNNIYDISYFPFENIYYTDNLKEDVLLFYNPSAEDSLNAYGVTITPNEILEEMVVLIDISSHDLNNFANALIHELTHVYDFVNFANYYYRVKYYNICEHKFFKVFQRWSEYHAHSFGEYYSLGYICTLSDVLKVDDYINTYADSLMLYLKSRRQEILSSNFNLEHLAITLGKIHVLDIHSEVQVASQSFSYQYLPLLFHSNLLEKVYNFHTMYFDLLKNYSILDNLENLKNLEEYLLS